MKKMHYSWVICGAGTLLLTCTVGATSNAFAAYLPFIKAQGYSGAQVSSILSVRCLFSLFGMLCIERYYKVLNLRAGLALSCLLSAAGFASYAFASAIWMYYFPAMLCGFAYGFGSLIPISILIRRWFSSKRAYAIGICASGTGIATICFPPAVTLLVENYGLFNTFMAEAFFLILCAGLAGLLLRNDPHELGLQPYGAQNSSDGTVAAPIKGGCRLPKGHLFGVLGALLLLGAVGTSGPGHFSVLFTTSGYSAMLASSAVSIFGISLTLSKLTYGLVSDRMGGCKSSLLFFSVLALGCLSCSLVDGKSSILVFLGVILMGLGYPPATVGISVWAADFSREADYAKTLKWFQISYSLGGLIFVSIPGFLYDLTGRYQVAYLAFLCVIPLMAAVIWRTYHFLTQNSSLKTGQ